MFLAGGRSGKAHMNKTTIQELYFNGKKGSEGRPKRLFHIEPDIRRRQIVYGVDGH